MMMMMMMMNSEVGNLELHGGIISAFCRGVGRLRETTKDPVRIMSNPVDIRNCVTLEYKCRALLLHQPAPFTLSLNQCHASLLTCCSKS